MPLYEVAVLETPSVKEQDEASALETLVFGPTAVVARDAKEAALRAAMDYPEDFKEINRDTMNVLVRPFA